jgi:hypothetical protein
MNKAACILYVLSWTYSTSLCGVTGCILEMWIKYPCGRHHAEIYHAALYHAEVYHAEGYLAEIYHAEV